MIQILEITAPAFQIVIDAIYHSKFIGESFEGNSFKEMHNYNFNTQWRFKNGFRSLNNVSF